MVNESLANDRHGFESAVRMRRKPWNATAVIHAPAIFAGEVLPDVTPRKRRIGTQLAIAPRVGIIVMNTQQKRIDRIPRKAEATLLNDRACFHIHPRD